MVGSSVDIDRRFKKKSKAAKAPEMTNGFLFDLFPNWDTEYETIVEGRGTWGWT